MRETQFFADKKEEQVRKQILSQVREYCERFHQKKPYTTGDRIPYAGRIYDAEEMTNLVDASLEFWLTSGRYTEQFEKKLAEYLQVKYCSAVNSGSSANLLAFMTLTSPLLGERRILPRGRSDHSGCRISNDGYADVTVWCSTSIRGCDDSTVQY